ncbi:MAG: multiheme c-type cytochrome [Candidatus Acidiferrales bacterium]
MNTRPDATRPLTLRFILLAAAVSALPIAVPMFGDSSSAAARPAATATTIEPSKYVGPGGCAATSCHGSVKPRADTRIFQNEYSIWVVQDKHSRAYMALTSPIGERIGRILGIGKSEQAPKCLACHALDVPPDARAKTFDLSDGVSCESCHGPASAWLGPHTTRGWTHAQSVAAGMYDTRDLVQRTEKCLSCHLGTQEKFVDHEMLAAGHPDLYFELDSFSAVMPRHWKIPRESAPGVPEAGGDDPWFGVRDWATGQAVQLRAALDRVAWRAHGANWPEFSELQCFACHHDLTPPEQSWRQERGYPGRRPGDPPWNASRYAVFAILAHEIDGATATQLDAQMTQLAKQMSVLNPDRDAVASTAASARAVADRLIARIQAQPYDRAMTARLLVEISGHANEISGQGERAAEQAAMALDSLFIASSRNAPPANAAEIRAAINALFQLLENPSTYDPNTFAAQMTKLNALLH